MFWLHVSAMFIYFCLCVNTQKPPNIVLILSDDQGYHDIGYHGAEIKTPNLDALAASGVRLENYYVQNLCSPSRMSMLSGRYQSHLGIQQKVLDRVVGGMPLDITTFPQILKKSNYVNHLVGKWHLGYSHNEYTPTYRGFDTFYGFYEGTLPFYDHCRGDPCCLDLHYNVGTNMSLVRTEGYTTNLFGDRAVDIIRKHNQEQPLFLYLAYNAPHFPLQAPKHYTDMYDFIEDEDRRIYAAMLTALDDSIGNVTQAIHDSGMWSNTILIFSGDNGANNNNGGYNYPLCGEKRGHYDGALRVNAFINSHLLSKPGRISRELLHITDWYPTLVKLAGGDIDGIQMDGFDVWDHISSYQDWRF